MTFPTDQVRNVTEDIHILWPQEYADEIVRIYRHTLETGEPYIVPERIEERRDRGVREFYEWQVHRIPLPDGDYGVVCYFRDISRQVLAREAIVESEKHQKLLTRELQHRTKNLLAVIQSIASRSLSPDRSKKEALEAYRKALAVNPFLDETRRAVEELSREVDGQDI